MAAEGGYHALVVRDRSQLDQLAEMYGGALAAVKYFTSQISAKASEDPSSPKRQREFIRAVKATAGVEVFEGSFGFPMSGVR